MGNSNICGIVVIIRWTNYMSFCLFVLALFLRAFVFVLFLPGLLLLGTLFIFIFITLGL